MDKPTCGCDERIAKLEALVRQALCKCVVGPYWYLHNNCQVHATLEQALADRASGEIVNLNAERERRRPTPAA